jgi:hypothetical protein
MSVFINISTALDAHLEVMVGKPALIAYENRNVEPIKDALYIRPTLIAGEVVQTTLGESGQDRNMGIYQVDVFAPSGKGKTASMAMADLIADHFKRGTDLSSGGTTLRIMSVSRQVAFNDSNGWFMLPVEINYIAFTEARI